LATVTGGTSYNDFDAVSGVRYYYRVAARNACGEGSASAVASGYRGQLAEIFRDAFESGFVDRWTRAVPKTWYVDCDRDGFALDHFEAAQIDKPASPPARCLGGWWTDVAPASPATRDCFDQSADVFPGQADYFPSAYSPGGGGGFTFDYDCDGYHKERYTTMSPDGVLRSCSVTGAECRPFGWPGWDGDSVPVCGQTADYLDCGWVSIGGLLRCSEVRNEKTQTCR